MADQLDYSVLDDPQLLQIIFHPDSDWSPPPEGATDHSIPVESDVFIAGRFHPINQTTPSILYFHGNGEVVSDYDWVSRFYNEIGANLFVAEYRGYGKSNGIPTSSNTVADAHIIFKYFQDMLNSNGYTGAIFIMGRSLGSQSALELATSYPSEIKGLILESGFIQNVRLLKYVGIPLPIPNLESFEKAAIKRISEITMPVLIIHGDLDTTIPHTEAENIYSNIGSSEKKLLTIRGSDHNSLMLVGLQEYFDAIKKFITGG
ncbi:MAG: alpha/beta hydrolase [Chloroflexi bacterium]|nr:alpha/beta hydrolase [Chloroflexota bacterium]